MKTENHNGLLTVAGTNQCLGYLFDFSGKGIFSPDGKVEITPSQMDTHNKILAQMEIAGLDKCEIGYRGTLYLTKRGSASVISTFTGEIVSTDIFIHGKAIAFNRNGKKFSGLLQKDADCFNFKRTK